MRPIFPFPISPLAAEMDAHCERMREARRRIHCGLAPEADLVELLDDAADLLEEAADDVRARFAFECQVGVSLANED